MAHASWNGTLTSESDQTIPIEGNHDFPKESVGENFLRPSSHTSVGSRKGTASYYEVAVDDMINPQAAWYDPNCSTGSLKSRTTSQFRRG